MTKNSNFHSPATNQYFKSIIKYITKSAPSYLMDISLSKFNPTHWTFTVSVISQILYALLAKKCVDKSSA